MTNAVSVGREAGFVRDIASIAGRALRQVLREPTSVIPAVFVPAFFYAVNLGALENVTKQASRAQLQGLPHSHGDRIRGDGNVAGADAGDRHSGRLL